MAGVLQVKEAMIMVGSWLVQGEGMRMQAGVGMRTLRYVAIMEVVVCGRVLR